MFLLSQHIYQITTVILTLCVLMVGCVDPVDDASSNPIPQINHLDAQSDPFLSENLEQPDQQLLYSLSSGRTPAEERLAGELESLLPGDWSLVGAEALHALNITFLGHDAVTGDIALLIEHVADTEVLPSRVILDNESALLHFPHSERSYLIEYIDADRLELHALETGQSSIYLRTASLLQDL